MEILEGNGSIRVSDPNAGMARCLPRSPCRGLEVEIWNGTTDPKTGIVSGTLAFGRGIELTISGSITPAGEHGPQGVELKGEGHSSLNHIRGYFIEGSPHPLIVGTVVAVHNDLAKQPDGTSGPFVLYKASSSAS